MLFGFATCLLKRFAPTPRQPTLLRPFPICLSAFSFSSYLFLPQPLPLSAASALFLCMRAFQVLLLLLPVVNKMNFAFGNPSYNISHSNNNFPHTLATLMNTTLFFMSCQTLFSIHFVVVLVPCAPSPCLRPSHASRVRVSFHQPGTHSLFHSLSVCVCVCARLLLLFILFLINVFGKFVFYWLFIDN